jgi:phosphatidylinositol phospholipase C delta
VYHGNTLTSSVSVREVCRAIAKYGFLASPYPIIISAEVHCCLEQQNVLARILRLELGEALVVSELHEASGVLPSPQQLRGKILFKVSDLYSSC